MIREAVDFHFIPARQEDIHLRLLNWGKWCHATERGSASAPMFQHYRSPAKVRADADIVVPVDTIDAGKIEKAVRELPLKIPAAMRWHYVSSGSPGRCARELGVSLEGLARLVVDGRSMLINRRA